MLVATASLFLLTVLVSYPLEMVLIQGVGFSWGSMLGALSSVMIASLLAGYLFVQKLSESRKKAAATVSVLFTALMVIMVVVNSAAIGGDFTQWVHESYQEANPQASLSTFAWFVIGGLYLGSQMFMNVATIFPISFVGLYVGSMLKRREAS